MVDPKSANLFVAGVSFAVTHALALILAGEFFVTRDLRLPASATALLHS
jgi:hypothetical protein